MVAEGGVEVQKMFTNQMLEQKPDTRRVGRAF